MRKMRLSDIMSESFSKYLMGLDGDFIAPTGARLSDLLEALKSGGGEYSPDVVARAQGLQKDPAEDPEKYLARAERELSATSPIAPGAPMLPDIPDEDDQGEPQPPAVTPPAVVAPSPTTAPAKVEPAVTPPSEDEMDAVIHPPATKPGAPPPTSQPPTDPDNDVDHELGGGDSSTVDVPERPEGGPAVFEPTNPPVKPEDATGAVDVAGDSPDDSSKELGGPDEFDEKNKPFTAQMDALITGMASDAAAGSPADVYSVSERALRRGRSLVEAVYGPRTLVIDRR